MLALLCLRPLPAFAAEAPEAGVVEIPAAAADQDETAWKAVEEQRGKPGFQAALGAWLLAHPHGVLAARALLEQASLQENLLDAAATLRSARGEGAAGVWGSKASLELVKLEYAQDRIESALTILDDADTWPRGEDIEGDWLFWRGQCRLALKGFERAKTDLERFAAAYPKHPKAPQAQLGLAECAAALKDDEGALKGFERIYQDPKSEFGAQALWGAATLRQRRQENAEAQRLFKRLKAQYPASFEATAAKERLEQLSKLPPPRPTATPAPKPWPRAGRFYVQVGAFSKRATAQKLQRALKARRYAALLVAPGARTRFYIVKVGPFRTRAAAEAGGRKLSSHEKLTQQRIVEE